MIIDKDKRFLFIHNPRTSGTSIRRALLQVNSWSPNDKEKMIEIQSFYEKAIASNAPVGIEAERDWKHITLDMLPVGFSEGYSYVFVTVRNPFARLLSCYLRWHQELKSPNIYTGFKEYIDTTYLKYKEGCIQMRPRLEQSHWYEHSSIHEIIKCEDITEEKWAFILHKCSVDEKVERRKGVCQSVFWHRPWSDGEHFNRFTRVSSNEYKKVYDNNMREKVEEMCSNDLKMFDYKFERD